MVQVTQNGKYNNIQLKTFKGQPGLSDGESIEVTKIKYPEAKSITKTGTYGPFTMHLCVALYQGQEVSFILFDGTEAAAWNECGGLGDTVKITMTEEKFINKKGQKAIAEKLKFEKV